MAIEHLLIRPYHRDTDYPQVKLILEESGLYYDNMDSKDKLDKKARLAVGSIIVAEIDGQIVGTVRYMHDQSMAFIFRLAVKEEFRNQGIGSALMEEVDERLKHFRYPEVNILVDEDDVELKDYYKKRGYEEGNQYRWMSKEF